MKIKNFIFYTFLFTLFTGCDQDNLNYQELTDSKDGVFLYIKKALNGGEHLTIFPQNNSRQTKVSVSFGGVGLPASDISIQLTKDVRSIDSINNIRVKNGQEPYELFPDDAYTLDKSSLLIKKGQEFSDYASLDYNSLKLDLSKKYAVAYKATNDKGYAFKENGQTIFFFAEVIESELPKANWSATISNTATQSGDNGGAAALIDGKPDTFWHTSYSLPYPSWPFYASLKFSNPQYITKLILALRHNAAGSAPKDFDVEISNDGTNYTFLKSFTNTSKVNGDIIEFEFDELIVTEYIRLKFKNGHHDNWMTLAEISFIGYK